jgi:hypothetical protein
MLLDGVFASEAMDTSGEVLSVEGCDISTLDTDGQANWEHRNEESPGHTASDVVGRIVFAKKIFGEKDCENDRQRGYWKKLELPFIYGIVRLYDAAGHQAAKDLAAIVRDHHANGEQILVRFSIEGSTLSTSKDKTELLTSVARRVALTVKPCNRSCESGLLADPNAPEGFEKSPEKQDFVDEVLKRSEIEHPMYMRLGGSREIECAPMMPEGSLTKDEQPIAKTLTAGSYNAAPSTLTGGAALQREHIIGRETRARAKAAFKRYRPENGDLRQYLKNELPEASDDFIDRFAGMVESHKVKKSDILLGKSERDPGAALRRLEALGIELKKALAIGRKQPLTTVPNEESGEVQFNGKKVQPGVAEEQAGGKKYALLHSDVDHYIGVPADKVSNWSHDDLKKWPKNSWGLYVTKPPVVVDAGTTVDARQHGDALNQSPEQQGLIHGLDFGLPDKGKGDGYWTRDRSHWRKGPKGIVFVKGAEKAESNFNEARREVAYHNLAKNFFGLGEYVPTAALVRHPKTGQEHAVIEKIKHGEHARVKNFGTFTDPIERVLDDHHLATLKRLHDSGELDRLALMNTVLGNPDRHHENYMFVPDHPGIQLIDHGLAFDDLKPQPMALPSYLDHHHNHLDHQAGIEPQKKLTKAPGSIAKTPLHPAAVTWVQGLDPQQLAEHLDKNKVPQQQRGAALHRLATIQNALMQNPNLDKQSVIDSIVVPPGGQP